MGVVGKLHPVLVPGMDRQSLDGVLAGVKVDFLDEEQALDELAQRIENETGARPASSASWTRKKKRWLRKVDRLAKDLPVPLVVSISDHHLLLSRLGEAETALRDAEDENDSLREIIEELKSAKDATEVAAILLPKGDIERFKVLRDEAAKALREVSRPVRYVIRCGINTGTGLWPRQDDDPGLYGDMETAIADGYLIDNEVSVDLNTSLRAVRRADDATRKLTSALDGDDFQPEFYEWFDEEYGGPPELGLKAIWEKVFPRL